ncbi:hypothetical protein G9A89_006609 [Geosiphon pyriformis]|nr:hypothetical protein G9A89_006609 [Geosiphon pyriformis]
MELAGFFAGGSGFESTGLGFQSGNKKKARVESVYSHSSSYKKAKKPEIAVSIVNLLAGSLPAVLLHSGVDDQKVFWGSKVENKESSISKVLDIKNLRNTVAEEISYINSNTSETDDMVDNATPRKINNNTELVLLAPKFVRSNQLLLTKSHVKTKRSFEPVRLYALNIELSSVSGKTNGNKLVFVKKNFYQIDGFGGRVLTPSKFPGIIRSSFTSELSLKKARELAIHEKFVANSNVRHVNKISDWVIVVKEILVNLPKLAVESVFSKFGRIVSIKMQLIGLWQKALVNFELSEIADLVTAKWSVFMRKNSVCVAKAVEDKQSWIFRDQHRTLLYTLPVSTTAHDFSGLLESYDEKTCFIGCNPMSYVHDRCAIMCFVDEASKLAAIGSAPVFKGVNLCWAGLSLAICAHCKQFGHISAECSLGGNSGFHSKQVITPQNQVGLANIYKKKQVPIVCPVFFGGKTWAQVAGGSLFCKVSLNSSGFGSSSGAKSVPLVSDSCDNFCLAEQMASLEHSLELLADQVSDILKKLSFVDLAPLMSSPYVSPPVVVASITANMDSNMALDVETVFFLPPLSAAADSVVDLSSSSFRVLTTKVGRLEFKMVALEVLVESVLERLNCLCSDLGSLALFSSQ